MFNRIANILSKFKSILLWGLKIVFSTEFEVWKWGRVWQSWHQIPKLVQLTVTMATYVKRRQSVCTSMEKRMRQRKGCKSWGERGRGCKSWGERGRDREIKKPINYIQFRYISVNNNSSQINNLIKTRFNANKTYQTYQSSSKPMLTHNQTLCFSYSIIKNTLSFNYTFNN